MGHSAQSELTEWANAKLHSTSRATNLLSPEEQRGVGQQVDPFLPEEKLMDTLGSRISSFPFCVSFKECSRGQLDNDVWTQRSEDQPLRLVASGHSNNLWSRDRCDCTDGDELLSFGLLIWTPMFQVLEDCEWQIGWWLLVLVELEYSKVTVNRKIAVLVWY